MYLHCTEINMYWYSGSLIVTVDWLQLFFSFLPAPTILPQNPPTGKLDSVEEAIGPTLNKPPVRTSNSRCLLQKPPATVEMKIKKREKYCESGLHRALATKRLWCLALFQCPLQSTLVPLEELVKVGCSQIPTLSIVGPAFYIRLRGQTYFLFWVCLFVGSRRFLSEVMFVQSAVLFHWVAAFRKTLPAL